MAREPVIVFDTNSLRQIGWNSAPFRQLVELSATGSVRVYVPEIVYHERRTQWRDDFSKRMTDIAEAVDRFALDAVVAPADRQIFVEIRNNLPPIDAEKRSRDYFERFFYDSHFHVVRITDVHTEEAFDRYFSGATPFKSIKARNDIPDGFVFAAMLEVHSKEKNIYCLSSDKELVSALKAVEGIAIFDGVEEVLKEPGLIALRDELETNKAWLRVKKDWPVDRANEEIIEWVSDRSSEFLEHKRVWSEKIPSDDQEGVITFHDYVDNVLVSEFNDWGGGALTATVSFTSDVQIDFYVFRGDAYSVPDWVSVDEGDFEADHYFEAQGSGRVKVTLEVSVQAVISDDYDDEGQVVTQVSIDQEPRLTFLGGV